MLVYFAATLFVSASLLFLVQPMVGKMILPRLGGTPAVWNTCMVFFQGVLLIGYGYTHSLTTWCSRRTQLIVQMAILIMPFAFFVLPFSMGNWQPPGDANPILSVLWLLLGMVGLPFFVVATSAPLLQKWFADTGHPASKDPYFLYGASSLGSMLALILYPLAVEPLFAVDPPPNLSQTRALLVTQAGGLRDQGRGEIRPEDKEQWDRIQAQIEALDNDIKDQSWLCQTRVWTIGYGLLAVLVGGCAFLVWNTQVPQAPAVAPAENPPTPAPIVPKTEVQPLRRQGRRGVGWKTPQAAASPPVNVPLPPKPVTLARRLRWLGLAAAPSSLMLGVTTHLTTDVAAIPFFWVIPLALYLLTFILVFARFSIGTSRFAWTDWPHTVVLYMQPFLLVMVVMYLVSSTVFKYAWLAFLLHVLLFFLTTLVCHGELAKDRPGTKHLTEFYLWMSLGGVLGGIFNAMIAPFIFWTGTLEYPLAMIFAYFLRPKMVGKYVLIPGDSDAYETTRLGRGLDFVVPALVGVWTYLVFITAAPFLGAVPDPNGHGCVITKVSASSPAARAGLKPDDVIVKVDGKDLVSGDALDAVIRSKTPGNRIGLVVQRGTERLTMVVTIGRFEYFTKVRTFHLGDFELDISVADMAKILAGMIIMGMFARPFRFGLALAIVSVITLMFQHYQNPYIYEERDFFGFVRVREDDNLRVLIHGDIDHGSQQIDPNDPDSPYSREVRRRPITYFHPKGGIGQVFERFSWYGGPSEGFSWPDYRVPVSLLGMGASPLDPAWALLADAHSEPAYACIGLGIGSLGAHAKPFQFARFYEIQPAVKRLSLPGAGKRPIFYFLQDAKDRGADMDVILGDGRLTLEKHQVEKFYHILVIDAFSSDAIPVHLLTREALEMYLSKLADGGVLIFNTTNRYVDLRGVLRDLADDLDLTCYYYGNNVQPERIQVNGEAVDNPEYVPLLYGADWVILQRRNFDARSPTFNGTTVPMPDRVLPTPFKRFTWNDLQAPNALEVPPRRPVWTDRYSNLLRVMSWR